MNIVVCRNNKGKFEWLSTDGKWLSLDKAQRFSDVVLAYMNAQCHPGAYIMWPDTQVWTDEMMRIFIEHNKSSGLVTKWGKFKAGDRVRSLAESDEANHGKTGEIVAVGPAPFKPKFAVDDYEMMIRWDGGGIEPGIWNMIKKI